MTESNRTRICWVTETTLGTTPTTPRMRTARMTGETLSFAPAFIQSEELRSDRMNADPVKVNETNTGPVNGELSYPVYASPLASWFESGFQNTWSDNPFRDNDGTADSVITDMSAAAGVITCTTGVAFVVGHLIYNSGFTNSGNNGLFKITTGSATVPAVGASMLTNETAPPAAARIKVVGLQGVSGDLVAVADGITSTTLDFTTVTGLVVGKWIKIGGTGSGFRFATEACNEWARVTVIVAAKITLDNLPATWTTDAGTGKTLRIFFGDQLKNGVTKVSGTIERGFLGMTTPSYILQKGMVVGQLQVSLNSGEIAKTSYTFSGMTGSVSTSSVDASPDAATTNAVMAAAVNVGRISEAGTAVVSPNYIKSLQMSINNNLRMLDAIRSDGLVGAIDIGSGECDVEVTLETYFGDQTLYAKLLAGTATNLNARLTKDNQAIVFAIPRLTLTGGAPSAQAKNQDVMVSLTSQASYDTLTAAHVVLDRMDYYQV